MQNDIQTEADSCDLAATFIRGALLLQEKWVMLIVHSLMEGPISFCDLMRKGSINTTTLTQRLNLLEQTGLLTKTIHSTMPPRTSYELTEAGLALRPILDAITDWSERHLHDLSAEECPGQNETLDCEAACSQ